MKEKEKTAWEKWVVVVVAITMEHKKENGDPISPTDVTPGYPEKGK